MRVDQQAIWLAVMAGDMIAAGAFQRQRVDEGVPIAAEIPTIDEDIADAEMWQAVGGSDDGADEFAFVHFGAARGVHFLAVGLGQLVAGFQFGGIERVITDGVRQRGQGAATKVEQTVRVTMPAFSRLSPLN